MKNSAIHIQTFAIELRKFSFSVTLSYIFDFKSLKYVKSVRFRLLLEAKIIFLNQQYTFKHLRLNGVSPVLPFVTLAYIFDFKCLKFVKFVHFRILTETKIMKKPQQ